MQFLDKAKEFDKNPLLKKLIFFLVITLLLYLGLDILLHQQQIGLTFKMASHTILGNEEEFLDPILFDALLEHVHANILSSMLTLLLLSSIYIRLNPKSKQRLIHVSFITAIFSHITLLLTTTLSLFISIWIILFLLWHFSAFLLGLVIIGKLVK
ncbi:MAG: Unknown protein [uncultured Sulfurovum sp.]|uniref:Uncharacterized protein n=1 Tax=uncultured Sulfurovum sp. TaxID=269237 RepID=A0A6S6SE51_9BACT|nr:MAG: Unknown protein [uncultured Sulfurovum sp.]